MKKKAIELSVVIPVLNEEENLKPVCASLIKVLKKAVSSYEIIFINDGSRDDSLKMMHALAKKHSEIRVLSFSRNFGKEIATTAGVHHAEGQATLMFDADGQFPADKIPEFIEKWKAGAQVVIGVRDSNQKEGVVKRYGSKLFYSLFNLLSESAIMPRSTDFRLIDEVVREEFIQMTERHRMTRGLIDWLGFKRDYVTFNSSARLNGEAGYKFYKLATLGINSLVSLSLKPLFLFGWVGAIITGLSVLLGLFVLVEQFILGDPLQLHVTGSGILGIFISFMVGLVLMSQAIIATYLSHVHTQTQARPLFIIDKSHSVRLSSRSEKR